MREWFHDHNGENCETCRTLEASIAEAEPQKALRDAAKLLTELVVEAAYTAVVQRLGAGGFTLGDNAQVRLRAALEAWAGSEKLGL